MHHPSGAPNASRLAALVQISQSGMTQLLSGKNRFSPEVAQKVLGLAGKDQTVLLGESAANVDPLATMVIEALTSPSLRTEIARHPSEWRASDLARIAGSRAYHELGGRAPAGGWAALRDLLRAGKNVSGKGGAEVARSAIPVPKPF